MQHQIITAPITPFQTTLDCARVHPTRREDEGQPMKRQRGVHSSDSCPMLLPNASNDANMLSYIQRDALHDFCDIILDLERSTMVSHEDTRGHRKLARVIKAPQIIEHLPPCPLTCPDLLYIAARSSCCFLAFPLPITTRPG